MADQPNIAKLEAVYKALGPDPSISFQPDATSENRDGFWTVTVTRNRAFCIGQGDTLAAAISNVRETDVVPQAYPTIEEVEQVAA